VALVEARAAEIDAAERASAKSGALVAAE